MTRTSLTDLNGIGKAGACCSEREKLRFGAQGWVKGKQLAEDGYVKPFAPICRPHFNPRWFGDRGVWDEQLRFVDYRGWGWGLR